MSGGPASLLIKRRALLISAVAFISYAYFYQGGGWNQNSRFDLVRAIVEQQTLRIDAYHDNTYDKAYYQGHYYSDKAPGLALLAVPAAALERPLLRAVGIDPASPRAWVATSYFVTLFAVALPAAFACACLFLIALKLGSSEGGAAFAALSMAFATPIWAYATLFWGHALAAACLLFAFAAGIMLRSSERARSDFLWGVALGLSAGWATVSEYPAAPASMILAVFALAQVWRNIAWRDCVHCRADGLSGSRLRLGFPSQLCVLPGGSLPLDEARLHGADLSACRSHVEAVVRLPPRTFYSFSHLSCDSFRIESAMEKSRNSRCCCGRVGRRRLLPPL